MAKGGFDYRQFKAFYENMNRLAEGHRKFIEGFLLQMALRLLAKTKKRTPVDTGDLRDSWYLSKIARRGDDVMINIINPKLYASHVEFGHMTVNRTSWVDGYFMCTVSMQEIEREMPKRFAAAWKKYAEDLLGR
jgi:hypothetical protein